MHPFVFVVIPMQMKAGTDVLPFNLTRLPNGSCVEWVRDRININRIRLLVSKHGRTTIADEVESNEQIFRAPALNPSIAKALCLPAEILPGGSSNERIDEIISALEGPIHLTARDYLLAASFSLSTWFPEWIDVYPYLVITGPSGSGKSTFLRLLRCFCRRPILLGDISTAALYRLADQVSPTLLLDECEFDGTRGSRTLRRFLRMGNAGGQYVARGGEVFDGSCPKVICVNEAIEDVALSTRAIHISILPSNRDLEPVDKSTLDRIADEQQAKLLGFRIENRLRVCVPSLATTDRTKAFSPKLRDIARALLAPLFGDERLESELIQALEAQDDEAVVERSNEPMWQVANVLFGCCHQACPGEATVGSIAEKVNRLRIEAGLKPFTARKVGAILKILGVKTMSLGNWGRGIEFSPQFHRKAHALARQFAITRRDITNWMAVKGGYGGPACNLCLEFDLMAGLRPSPAEPKRRRARLFSQSDHDEVREITDDECVN